MSKGAYKEVRDRDTTQPQRSIAPLIRILTLALLVALVLRTNNHYLSVSLYYFAFIAHRLY